MCQRKQTDKVKGDTPLSDVLHDILQSTWGYSEFRPLQLDIITSVMDGNDTLGLLPTGGGKSITFQVPALALAGLTLVVTPLISLMKDQVDNLLQRGVRAYCLHSGMSHSETRLVMDRCRLGKTKILYISPERLNNDNFLEELRTWNLSLLVVDEAHCISQWGYDFRPSYLHIKGVRNFFTDIPILALTASATPQVAQDIKTQLLFRPGNKQFTKSFIRENISYIIRHDEYKERTLLRVLNNTQGSAIVYVRSRKRCCEIASMLQTQGIPAAYYHAGLDPEDKSSRQNEWKSGTIRVMVATNAFGMGIDKPDVRVVAHMDLPSSLEEYYQEAGRAGRDGKPSYAVLIVAKSDKGLLSRHLNEAFPPKEYIRQVYEKACNFLDVAIGYGFQQIFEFNFPKFCQLFHLQPGLAESALKLLSRAEYIDYIDELHTRSRVMIVAQKQELYSLRLDEITERVFLELQRMYTGLFSDFTYIRETAISLRSGVSVEEVYQALLILSRMNVLIYVPKKSTPYLYFPTSREELRYILIPKAVYEDRRDKLEKQLTAMKNFAFDNTRCRVQTMLEYFGEKQVKDCGTCDVCRGKKRKTLTVNQEADIADKIIEIVSASTDCTIYKVISRLNQRKEDVIEILRVLADESRIIIKGDLITLNQYNRLNRN